VDHVPQPQEPEAAAVADDTPPDYSAAKTGLTCLPQRAALLKSMLNFLKKAIQASPSDHGQKHGCQMAYIFGYQKSLIGNIWEGLGKENVDIFYSHFIL
jgi:hypothetical protein